MSNSNAVRFQTENPVEKVVDISRNKPEEKYSLNISQFAANTDYEKTICHRVDDEIYKGMDAFPETLFNQIINYCLSNGKIKNAMYLICSANWGTRFSDTTRVRFCHLFDEYGNLKTKWTLPNGEQKTKKQNIYYNNKAVGEIIKLFLSKHPEVKLYDYLFTSDSYNYKTVTLQEVETDEIYNNQIELLEKKIKTLNTSKEKILKLYSNGKIDDDDFVAMNNANKSELSEANEKLEKLKTEKENYISENPDANKIRVKTRIGAVAAENIIKDTLKAMNVYTRNMNIQHNTDYKFNTHSLRKTFSEQFYNTGCRLADEDKLILNPVILKLLQDKLMHTSNQTTMRYNKQEENQFEIICTNMNVGLDALDALENFI